MNDAIGRIKRHLESVVEPIAFDWDECVRARRAEAEAVLARMGGDERTCVVTLDKPIESLVVAGIIGAIE